jgi:hypothetical protein
MKKQFLKINKNSRELRTWPPSSLSSFHNLFFAGLFIEVGHGGFKSARESADLRAVPHVVFAGMAPV